MTVQLRARPSGGSLGVSISANLCRKKRVALRMRQSGSCPLSQKPRDLILADEEAPAHALAGSGRHFRPIRRQDQHRASLVFDPDLRNHLMARAWKVDVSDNQPLANFWEVRQNSLDRRAMRAKVQPRADPRVGKVRLQEPQRRLHQKSLPTPYPPHRLRVAGKIESRNVLGCAGHLGSDLPDMTYDQESRAVGSGSNAKWREPEWHKAEFSTSKKRSPPLCSDPVDRAQGRASSVSSPYGL